MELRFSKEDDEFRDQVRTWLAENAPREARPRSGPAMREFDLEWQRRQWEGGWAGISWPVEYGGRGLSLVRQLIWYEEYAKLGLPPIDSRFVGLSHAGPTLIVHGTKEQQAFHLPRILRGEVVWCQGFSEPGAGSDLAAVRTRAVVDGDQLVVNGQKIWTSFADVADYQELLVRTNSELPRHRGLTWVICDMASPGIEVRPIRMMDGGQEFCEVYYDDVRVPLANIVGSIDNGWNVAMATLSFERGTAFMLHQVQLADTLERLIEVARSRTGRRGRPLLDDEEIARALAELRAEVTALKALTYMSVSRNMRSEVPGPEGSMLKLQWAELSKRVHRLAVEIFSPESLMLDGALDGGWTHGFLHSFSNSIGGGTSEIMRNIIAERVLGLPR